MPHGGGHIGGGGHHGGGHHGGGGFGHHHHHHRGGYGGVVYTSGPYYGGRRSRGFLWCGVGVFFVIVIGLSVGLSTHYATDTVADENKYTPGDSRLNTINTFFYEAVQVSSDDYGEDRPMDVYLLSKAPPLTERNAFFINSSVNVAQYHYEYWHFYLHPGSNISLSACTSNSKPYSFFIIQGSSYFKKWKDDGLPDHAKKYSYVSKSCSQGNQTLNYRVSKEGHFYLAYTTSQAVSRGAVRINLQRYEYSTDNLATNSSCQVSTSLSICKFTVDMLSPYNKVLVKVPFNPQPEAYEHVYTVQYKHVPRATAYIIVTVVPFVAMATCCLVMVLALLCYKRSQHRKYDPLLPKTVQHDHPPPYNPNYT